MAVQRDKIIANAEKLVAKGKIDSAIKEYEHLLDDNPNDVNTLNRIGDLWVRINRNDEAVKTFTKIADHYSKDGFFLKAIAIYKKINKLDPSKLDIYAKLADLYAKQGLAMEAKSQYQVLADYYLKHGDPGNALGIYRKISELDPNSINVHVKLADLYSQNNQTAEALKEYDRVGRMLLKRGMLDEAMQVFKKALKIDSKNIELVDSLVTALLEAKDYDNATAIVEQALEANRDHPRLTGLWGRIQLAKGDVASARSTLERAVAANPEEPVIRETLADIYLKMNSAAGALEMIAPLVDKALTRGERGAAVEMLNRVLRVDSGHTPTLEKLVGVYMRLNEETNILASMNSLAEAHIAKGQFERAAQVLERLIAREPQNAQHRNKLQFVKSQIGGVDTLPARPKSVEQPMPSMELDEPAPSFDLEEPSPSFELDLDSGPALELDLSAFSPEPAPPPAAPAPAPRLAPAVELAAADLAGDSDDLDFITEHLTEAEVFAKYGLAEKAAEHLRAVIDRAPKNVTAHERLYKILLDEGDIDNARDAAMAYVDLLMETGEDDAVTVVNNEFTSRGHSLAAKAPAATAAVAEPEFVPRLEEMAEEELSFDLDTNEPSAFDIESISTSSVASFEPTIEEPVVEEPLVEDPVMAFDEPEPVVEEPELMFEEPPLATFADLEPVAAGGITFDDLASEVDELPEAAPAETEEQPFFGMEAAAPHEPTTEELGEVDFYIGQELYDEAREKVEALLDRYPDAASLADRRDAIQIAAAAAAATAPRPTAPPVLSRDEIENELLSAIPDDDEDIAPPPPPPAAPAMQAAAPAATAAEENLFADEDDFFDLAAELESELGEEEPLALSEEEQSLEEIFKEFKKGVEQQLDSEDYDTHYNLGIAYKEMGLIDEAIGEFQLASKDPKRAVECASMLGLCFLEKGMPQLAIKWYRKGIEMPEITEDEHVGLLYDLGSAYLEVGDTQNAQKAFMEVYGMNTNYRDIVSRIKQVEGAV
jgi:pilus assembly protein FimV